MSSAADLGKTGSASSFTGRPLPIEAASLGIRCRMFRGTMWYGGINSWIQ